MANQNQQIIRGREGEKTIRDAEGAVSAVVQWNADPKGRVRAWVRLVDPEGRILRTYAGLLSPSMPTCRFLHEPEDLHLGLRVSNDSMRLVGNLPLTKGFVFNGPIAEWTAADVAADVAADTEEEPEEREEAEEGEEGEASPEPEESDEGDEEDEEEDEAREIDPDETLEWFPPPEFQIPGYHQAGGWRRAGTIIRNPYREEIFRFLCVRPPQSPDALEALLGLVILENPGRLPFYKTLEGLRDQPDARRQMMEAACDFAQTPVYVTDIEDLGEPVVEYPLLAAQLRAIEGVVPLSEVLEVVDKFLFAFGFGPLDDYLASKGFKKTQDRVWQTLFAVALGALGVPPDPRLGDCLVGVLQIDHFLLELQRELAWKDGADGEQPLRTPLGRETALTATPVIPEGAVPPAPGCEPDAPLSLLGWARAQGIGDLKIVDQCLLGYRLGAVADTVNVMARECLVVSDRELARDDRSVRSESTSTGQESEESERLSHSELRGELADVIAAEALCSDYNKLTQTYGSSTVTLDGTWSGNDCVQERSDREAFDYARGLTSRATARVERSVTEARIHNRLHEREKTDTRTLDNREGTERLLGIYRWLQERLELTLHSDGKRLILEFEIADPAAAYLQCIEDLHGIRLVRPQPPSDYGIHGPEDVTADNYRYLANTYHVEDVEPPPPAELTLIETLRAQPPVTEAEIRIPPDYQVTAGTASYLLGDTSNTLVGFVGADSFSHTGSPEADEEPVGSPSEDPDEDSSEAVKNGMELEAANGTGNGGCEACPDPFSHTLPPTTPVQGSAALTATVGAGGAVPVSVLANATQYSVSVTLTCGLSPSSGLLPAWQIATYDALVHGYDRCLRRYHHRLEARIAKDSAGDKRRIERRQLRDQALEILWEMRAITDSSPPASPPSSPPCPSPYFDSSSRFYSFFHHALEWLDATYAFHPWPPGDEPCGRDPHWLGQALFFSESDELFESFLRACSARMLVPVRPGDEAAVLYYLAYGLIWLGSERDAPVAGSDVALILDLQRPDEQTEKYRWTVEVPTSMRVLQADDTLPSFECPPCS